MSPPLLTSCLIGIGSYLPQKKVSNKMLEDYIETSDDWIQKRTGIAHRHIVAENESTASIAIAAAEHAIKDAAISPTEIDLVILATTTPDNTFPATAARIQHALGIPPCPFFDIQAVCSGFIYALAMSDNMLKLGQAKTALVVGAEVYSKILDWKDRSTCVLFGDGAGAVILRAQPQTPEKRGILSTHLCGDGGYYDSLYVDGGVATTGTSGCVRMQGKEVFRFAIEKMTEAMQIALAHNGYSASDMSWFVPHQANLRIMRQVALGLGLRDEQVISTVREHANISAATIPVALDYGAKRGYYKDGDLIGFSAMGGGFTWGSALLRWSR